MYYTSETLRHGDGAMEEGMQCNAMKEGKAFPVLFGDLTSHYPISSPALGNKRVSSSSSRREILYALHCTLHTAACHFLFFPSTSPCYTCTFDSSNSSRAPYPLCFPLPTAQLVSRGMYGDTGDFLVYRAGLIKAVHGILAKLQLLLLAVVVADA